MRLSSMLPALPALLLCAHQALALAPQQTHLTIPQGIKQLRQVNGQIYVQDLANTWQQIGVSGNRLTLSPAPPPVSDESTDPNRLPDTVLTTGSQGIRKAWFARPTRRYGHGVLGDAVEAGSLKAELDNGKTAELVLAESAVFEDRLPRLADIDGDGRDEILVVKSYLDRGAAVSLIGAVDGHLEILAESPAIGLSHRWLNPVGAADFDGDGKTEIAVVITPHIGGTLQLYEWQGSRLVPDHRIFGFSNHAMGSRELGLSAVIDINGDGVMDMVVPDAGRQSLVGISFSNGQLAAISRVPISGQFASGLHVTDLDQDGQSEILYATSDKSLTRLRWRQ